jgi:hypothetical protein
MREIARQAPAFGGVMTDSTGALTISVTDLSRGEAAAAAVRALLAQRRQTVNGVRFRRVDYSYQQLRGWYDRFIASSAVPGITVGGVDESRNRVHIGAIDEDAVSRVKARLTELGVPAEATIVEISSPVVFSSGAGSSFLGEARIATAFSDDPRQYATYSLTPKLWGGIKIHNSFQESCTLAFMLHRDLPIPFWDPADYILTASHCSHYIGVVAGTLYQPDFTFLGPIADEYLDPYPYMHDQVPACPSGRLCRNADATVYKLRANSGRISGFPDVIRAGANLQINSLVSMRGQSPVVMTGSVVRMAGYVSGETTASVDLPCEDVPFYYNLFGTWIDSGITMLCQARAPLGAQEGDSGGSVWSTLVQNYAAGIVVARSNTITVYTYFTRMSEALAELAAADGNSGTYRAYLP